MHKPVRRIIHHLRKLAPFIETVSSIILIYGNSMSSNLNVGTSGSGVCGSGVTIDSCVITRNSGGYSCGGVFRWGANTVRNSVIYDNTPYNWVGSGGLTLSYSCTTPDMGGSFSTEIVGAWLAERVAGDAADETGTRT